MTHSQDIDAATIQMSLRQRHLRNENMELDLQRRANNRAADERRSARNGEEDLHALMVANRRLKEDLEEANDLVDFWANGSEAFRRTIHHLKKNWQPALGDESDLAKIVDTEHSALRASAEWQEKKAASSEARRKAFRESNPRNTKPR